MRLQSRTCEVPFTKGTTNDRNMLFPALRPVVRLFPLPDVAGDSLCLRLHDTGHHHREISGSLQAHHIQVGRMHALHILNNINSLSLPYHENFAKNDHARPYLNSVRPPYNILLSPEHFRHDF